MQQTAGQCNVGYFTIQANAIFGTSNTLQCNVGNRAIQATACNTLQASVKVHTLQNRMMQYLVPVIQGSAMLGTAQ